VVGGDPFCLKFWVKLTPLSEIADFQSIFARSASAVALSKKVQKSFTPFPISLRWRGSKT